MQSFFSPECVKNRTPEEIPFLLPREKFFYKNPKSEITKYQEQNQRMQLNKQFKKRSISFNLKKPENQFTKMIGRGKYYTPYQNTQLPKNCIKDQINAHKPNCQIRQTGMFFYPKRQGEKDFSDGYLTEPKCYFQCFQMHLPERMKNKVQIMKPLQQGIEFRKQVPRETAYRSWLPSQNQKKTNQQPGDLDILRIMEKNFHLESFKLEKEIEYYKKQNDKSKLPKEVEINGSIEGIEDPFEKLQVLKARSHPINTLFSSDDDD